MQIYQIQIALIASKPKIWRQVLVPSDILLPDLHEVIQTTMGWENYHLHQFICNQVFFGPTDDDDMWEDQFQDYSAIKLSDLLTTEAQKMQYDYDFGDGWEHTIILEKILPYDSNVVYPVCVTGKMKCPPEDSGGVWGYMEMLEILKQPKHKEYKHYRQWIGRSFDPEKFDKDAVNKNLRS